MKNNGKSAFLVNDFQIFKGRCEQTMQAFGSPLVAHHEAELMIRDDQSMGGASSMYAIYQRSENRILQIIPANVRPAKVIEMKSKKHVAMSALDRVRLKFAA